MNKLDFKYLAIIFLIAIIARIIFHFVLYEPFADRFGWSHHPDQFRWYQDDNYDEIARNLLSGKGYSIDGEEPDIRRPPLYPLVLAAQFYFFGDGYYINLIITILFQSAVCIVLYYLTLQIIGDRKLAAISSFIWAVYPLPMLQAMGPFTEPVYELLLISFVYLLHNFYRLDDTRYLIYSSVLIVLVTLTRPITIAYPFFFAFITLFFRKDAISVKSKHIAVLMLIFAIGVAPWIYRGYTLTGKILPLVEYKSLKVYQDKNYDIDAEPLHSNPIENTLRKTGVVGRVLQRMQDPVTFIKDSLFGLIGYWYKGHSTPVKIVNASLQFPLLFLAILGIWEARKQKLQIYATVSTICFYWLIHAALRTPSRTSFPVIALLCPFVALGINRILMSSKYCFMNKEECPAEKMR